MAIRCIAATAIIIEIICFKSITYSSKLFFFSGDSVLGR
jgi:hypothetical protein